MSAPSTINGNARLLSIMLSIAVVFFVSQSYSSLVAGGGAVVDVSPTF